MITPVELLREAARAVPAVKYALGIGGILASVALINLFNIDARIAFVGVVVVLVLMGVLVVFARMTALPGVRLNSPALVLTWFVLLLFMATALSLFTSVFFRKPVDLQFWIKSDKLEIGTPALYKPFDNTIFNHFPRTTTVRWQAVNEATHYLVEVQYSLPNGGEWFSVPGLSVVAVEENQYSFQFPGAQPGRWRVTAVSASGVKSVPSNWWHFRYER